MLRAIVTDGQAQSGRPRQTESPLGQARPFRVIGFYSCPQPACRDHAQEFVQPALEMHVPRSAGRRDDRGRLRAWQLETVGAAHHPALHHHLGQFAMETGCPRHCRHSGKPGWGRSPPSPAASRREAARSPRDGTGRPLRPVHQFPAGFGRLERGTSRSRPALRRDPRPCAEMVDQHLRAQADAEERPVLLERYLSQLVSRRTNSSSSLALIGPPNTTVPHGHPAFPARHHQAADDGCRDRNPLP